jgi:excisionase family DNA binding protein
MLDVLAKEIQSLDGEGLDVYAELLQPLTSRLTEARSVVTPMLTTAQAAAFAAVGEETIRRAVRGGSLQSYRVGRAIRLRQADLESWLATPTTRRCSGGVRRKLTARLPTVGAAGPRRGVMGTAVVAAC